MCIYYFAEHPGCDHTHIIGAYFCTFKHCPGDAQHIYHIEDSGYDCERCIFKIGRELDPDVMPVQYYPPGEDIDIDSTETGSFDKIVKVSSSVYQRSEGSLSDVDSVTSHWKKEQTADEKEKENVYENKPALHRDEDTMSIPEQPQPVSPSPSTPQHRDRAQDQLAHQHQHLISEDMRQAGPSPNTTKHRNLVQDQLANLPNHLAHRRQSTLPVVDPGMSPGSYYSPPAVSPPVPPFYVRVPARMAQPWPHMRIPYRRE